MARFDVYLYSEEIPLVVDVQASLLADIKTRMVIPLLPPARTKKEALPRLRPLIIVKGKEYVMMTTELSSADLSDLGKFVENVEGQRQAIVDAVDFLFQGF
jgi:toxin CcdB